MECNKLQEKSLALAKELAALKLYDKMPLKLHFLISLYLQLLIELYGFADQQI